MSDPKHPAAPPPEVPEEFADAYRDAYRRAFESGQQRGADPLDELPESPTQEVVLTELRRIPDEDPYAAVSADQGWVQSPVTRWRASPWFVPSLLALAALVLVPVAYGVGSAVGDDGASSTATPATGKGILRHRHERASEVPIKGAVFTAPGGWNGPVTPVATSAISADCTAPPSSDSAGDRVTYNPENAIDDKLSTAWRCLGTAIGQTLTLRISGAADVAEVGLVPGYAKTDSVSGVDRYAQNNRITKVRWTLADGTSFVQRLDPDPSSRDLQLLRVPRTTTDTVQLEILAVEHGPRDTTAISEIALFAAK